MKRNLPALFIVLFISLNSMAQLNFERKQKFDFTDLIGGFTSVEINNDARPDLVFSYFDQNYIAYRLNESPDTVYSNVRYGGLKRIMLEKMSSKRALYVCDINNDTFDDIIFSEYDNSRIGIAINNQQSQFDDIYYFNSANKPTKILSADFNKDQLNDLALICEDSKEVQVFLGNSASLLSQPQTYSISGTPSDMELKDVNNDGFMDIMVSDMDNNKLQLLTGNENGTFTNGISIDTEIAPANIEIADFDGDQLSDVAVAYSYPSRVQIFNQLEDHTFSASTTKYPLGSISTLDFIVDDLNSDGFMDMAFRGKEDQMEFLIGSSDHLFSNKVTTNLYVNGNPYIPLGFEMKSVYYPDKLSFLCLNATSSNINGITLNSDFTINWDKRSLISCAQAFYKMDITDMNGDSIKDLLLNYNAAQCIELYYGKKDQGYQYVKNIPLHIDATEIKAFDINMDGHPDIIASMSNVSEVLINDGNNNFQNRIIKNDGYPNILVADVNNNGNPDLFLNSNLYLDVKEGNYNNFTQFTTNSVSRSMVMDFNHDEKPDLLVSNWDNNRILIYPGNGDGTFGNKIIITGQSYSLAVGDINKDGYDDIVAFMLDQQKLMLYRNNKNGGFTEEVIVPNYLDLYNVYILDVDHDGNEDIVLPCGVNLLKYYPINPDGSIGTEKVYSDGENGSSSILLTDADNDGNKDLFLLTPRTLERHSNKIKSQIKVKNLVQTYDGFPVDDLVESTLPEGLATAVKFNDSLTKPIDAGTYQTQIAIIDDLYKGTMDTVLVVNKAPLTVKAVDKAKVYGTINPTFKINYTGFVNEETSDIIDIAPTVSCSADQNASAGTYSIEIEGGSDNNYQLINGNGTLTVNKKSYQLSLKMLSGNMGRITPYLMLAIQDL